LFTHTAASRLQLQLSLPLLAVQSSLHAQQLQKMLPTIVNPTKAALQTAAAIDTKTHAHHILSVCCAAWLLLLLFR
jgi:hypothetical protein